MPLESSTGETRQSKRTLSQLSVTPAAMDGSSNEEDDTEPTNKRARLLSDENSTPSTSSAAQVASSSVSVDLVKKDAGEVRSMETDDVLVRFIQGEMLDTKSVQSLVSGTHSSLNSKASFTLLALMRAEPGYTLDPRHHANSNRLSLVLSQIAMSLKENHQALSTAAELQAEPSNTLSSGVKLDTPLHMEMPSESFSKMSSDLSSQPLPGMARSGAETAVWTLPLENDGVSVNPEVMERVVLSQTKLLPFSVDLEAFWQAARGDLDDEGFSACQQLHQEIVAGGVLGRTWQQLKVGSVGGCGCC